MNIRMLLAAVCMIFVTSFSYGAARGWGLHVPASVLTQPLAAHDAPVISRDQQSPPQAPQTMTMEQQHQEITRGINRSTFITCMCIARTSDEGIEMGSAVTQQAVESFGARIKAFFLGR